MSPFEVYQTYLALKNHFTKENYDYHKYCGKVKASLSSFYKRRDRFWYERMSRQKTDAQILDFFIANFALCDDPQSLWIGEIIKDGEKNYTSWMKKTQSLSYIFKTEVNDIFTSENFDEMFNVDGNVHPRLVKKYLQKSISLETLIILNNILGFKKKFDKKLKDPVWKFISLRLQKYSSFLDVDNNKFKIILKECIM